MTDDLSTKFAVLTDDRPEPADPAAPIHVRIKRRQRRRRGVGIVVTTAAVAAAALGTGPVLNSVRSAGAEPGVAGFGPPAATTSDLRGDHTKVLPDPWSAERSMRLENAHGYGPRVYYIARGTISTESWAVVVVSQEGSEEGCLLADESQVGSFGTPLICFDSPSNGATISSARFWAYWVGQGHDKEKGTVKIDATLVMGRAPIGARSVRITAGGKTYSTDAVATPATDKLRFFAIVIPRRDLKVSSVQPVDGNGHPISR